MLVKGSVKDIECTRQPGKSELGVGSFHFSDRYSIFDWGEMPDHIPNKGQSLCVMGAYNFELMERKGNKTHYRGLVTSDGRQIRLEDIDTLGGVTPNTMEIDLTNVIKPDQRIAYDGSLVYSYSKYHDLFEKGATYQIPTENMHRFYLPRSSSIFTRLIKKEIQLEDFGWVKSPVPGQRLDPPIVDFSSKYEDGDRYVSRQEAYKMTGLPQPLFTSFTEDVLKIGKLFSDKAEKAGMLIN